MSIFGKLDAQTIQTNSYWVEKGEYSAEVTKAEFKTNRDGDRQLFIQYTINNEDSQFLDSKVSQYFTLPDPEMTHESLLLMPPEEQKKIRLSMAKLKRTLCGNENNENQKGLGVAIDDLNDPDWNPVTLLGTKVDLAVSNYGANNQGVNINWVNLTD